MKLKEIDKIFNTRTSVEIYGDIFEEYPACWYYASIQGMEIADGIFVRVVSAPGINKDDALDNLAALLSDEMVKIHGMYYQLDTIIY